MTNLECSNRMNFTVLFFFFTSEFGDRLPDYNQSSETLMITHSLI